MSHLINQKEIQNVKACCGARGGIEPPTLRFSVALYVFKKQSLSQVAVTLSIANHSASLPIAYRLYLPETWANDAARRKKTHVPKDIRFKTKPQIALDQIRAAHAEGIAPGIVLADAGYGANCDFRAGVSALNLPYVVGIQSTPSVWPPGQAPLPPKPWSGRGWRPCNVRRDDEHKPVSVKDLALSLGKKAWRSVTWREGSNAPLASRFAAVRVHLAGRPNVSTRGIKNNKLALLCLQSADWSRGRSRAPSRYIIRWMRWTATGIPSPEIAEFPLRLQGTFVRSSVFNRFRHFQIPAEGVGQPDLPRRAVLGFKDLR